MSDQRFSKTGQPKMGATFTVATVDGPQQAKVVSKGWGHGGYATLILVGLEYEDGFRELVEWPDAREALS